MVPHGFRMPHHHFRSVNNVKVITRMKSFTIIAGSIILILILFLLISFPSHPKKWFSLKRGMTRNEVHTIIDTNNLILIEKFSMYTLKEEWYRKYFLGKWIVVLYYDNDINFIGAHVRYESKIFPFVKRARNYE